MDTFVCPSIHSHMQSYPCLTMYRHVLLYTWIQRPGVALRRYKPARLRGTRGALEEHSRGTRGYSRGTRGVLEGYSRGRWHRTAFCSFVSTSRPATHGTLLESTRWSTHRRAERVPYYGAGLSTDVSTARVPLVHFDIPMRAPPSAPSSTNGVLNPVEYHASTP